MRAEVLLREEVFMRAEVVVTVYKVVVTVYKVVMRAKIILLGMACHISVMIMCAIYCVA